MDALEELGINELNDAFAVGTTDPMAVTRHLLDRIERLDQKLGAFEAVLAENAMLAAEGAAKAISSGHRIGPFHGVPFVLKDLVHVEGTITTGGTNAHADRVSSETAVIAHRLIAAGGILLGKTKTVEVAYGASVAARLAPCGVGTDTGGSVRIPSAFCGLTGLKVTEGVLPLDGIQPLSHTLDTPGPMCRSALDAAIMYETMVGREPHSIDANLRNVTGLYGEMQKGISGLALGIMTDAERSIVDPAVLVCYDAALEQLAALGAELRPLTLPRGIDEMRFGVATIIGVEGYHYHGDLYEDPTNDMDEDVKKRIMAGKTEPSEKYVRLMRERLEDRTAFLAAMEGLAAFLTPSVPIPAPIVTDIDQDTAPSQFTRMVNHLGFCGLATPMGLTDGGLPASLHIVGRPRDEAMTLRIGAAFARTTGDIGRPGGWE